MGYLIEMIQIDVFVHEQYIRANNPLINCRVLLTLKFIHMKGTFLLTFFKSFNYLERNFLELYRISRITRGK